MNNYVAKHAHKFNKCATMIDRKKEYKKSGAYTDQAWDVLCVEDRQYMLELFEVADYTGIKDYCSKVLNWSGSMIYNLMNELRRGM